MAIHTNNVRQYASLLSTDVFIQIAGQYVDTLATDPDKFDGIVFTLALVDAITIFPPAKPLKAFTKPLKALTRAMNAINPRFTRHFAGAIGKMRAKIRKGDNDTGYVATAREELPAACGLGPWAYVRKAMGLEEAGDGFAAPPVVLGGLAG